MRDMTELHAEILERCIPGIWRDLGLSPTSSIEEWRKPVAGEPTCPDCGCRVSAQGYVCGPCHMERHREQVEPEYLEMDGPWEVD